MADRKATILSEQQAEDGRRSKHLQHRNLASNNSGFTAKYHLQDESHSANSKGIMNNAAMLAKSANEL